MKTMKQRQRNWGSVGKMLFVLCVSLGLASGASAQRGIGHGYAGGGFHGGGFHGAYHGYYHPYYAPRVYYAPSFYGGWGYGLGLGFGWDYGLGWGIPGWYGPWYYPAYPPYYYGRGPMPPVLNDEIRGIKSDYKAEIKDVKHDKALSHGEKEQKINQLEQERDAAITKARHDFFDAQLRQRYGAPQRGNNNSTQPQNNNYKAQPSNGNSSDDADHPEYSSGSSDTGGQ
ncbi:MAG TPA: hypothetical protein VGR89_06365 [Puia sp.]|nr:hypothetical protein [Puia sp.]